MACGYALGGLPLDGACPECGTAISESVEYARCLPATGHAKASLVVGIVSVPAFVLLAMPAIVLGVIAIGLGFYALQLIRRGGGLPSSQRIARAGIFCGALGCAVGLAAMCYFAFT